jgi:hypothetical protein
LKPWKKFRVLFKVYPDVDRDWFSFLLFLVCQVLQKLASHNLAKVSFLLFFLERQKGKEKKQKSHVGKI